MWAWNSKEVRVLCPPRVALALARLNFLLFQYQQHQNTSSTTLLSWLQQRVTAPGCLASIVSLERPSVPQTSCSQAWCWRQCVQQGAHRCLTLLLEQKCGQAITGMPDKDGLTIRHLGALNRNIQALDILSSYVADTARRACQRSHKGLISLHCAAGAGSVETMVTF